MPCKYHLAEKQTQPIMGQDKPLIVTKDFCTLKQQSHKKLTEVCQTLAAKGLDGASPSDYCPLARNQEWDKCPFNQI